MYNDNDSVLSNFLQNFDVSGNRVPVSTVNSLQSRGPEMGNYSISADTSGLTAPNTTVKESGFLSSGAGKGMVSGIAGGLTGLMASSGMSGEDKAKNSWEGVKDGVASAVPIAGASRAVEQYGKQAFAAVGGTQGGDFGQGFLDPFGNVLDKDVKGGNKVLSVLDPVLAGIIRMKAEKTKRRKEMEKKRKHEMDLDALERKENEEYYRAEQGLQSMENLKMLRQKQLGLIS